MMRFRALAYLKFLVGSTNQHGIHSPFIYSFVTQCLYAKTKAKTTTSVQLFLKSWTYFNANQVRIISGDIAVQMALEAQLGRNANGLPPYDLVFVTLDGQAVLADFLKKGTHLHNNSMILIDGIHQSKATEEHWQGLQELPVVTVSMDLFYCGVLFFRKEQVKEHFKIRI